MRTILPNRLYRSGTGWCIWRWTFVDSGYITRLHLLKTPWFAVCLHWLNSPDPEPFLHDHPVTFLSIILRGHYWEEKNNKDGIGTWFCKRNWYNFIRASSTDQHTIVKVAPGTLTLAFMGPKVREWGFHSGEHWIGWKDYYSAQRVLKTGREQD